MSSRGHETHSCFLASYALRMFAHPHCLLPARPSHPCVLHPSIHPSIYSFTHLFTHSLPVERGRKCCPMFWAAPSTSTCKWSPHQGSSRGSRGRRSCGSDVGTGGRASTCEGMRHKKPACCQSYLVRVRAVGLVVVVVVVVVACWLCCQ
jgi:hypothetical protein